MASLGKCHRLEMSGGEGDLIVQRLGAVDTMRGDDVGHVGRTAERPIGGLHPAKTIAKDHSLELRGMPLLHSSGQDLGLLGPSFGDDRIDGIARPTEQGIEEIGERVFVVR